MIIIKKFFELINRSKVEICMAAVIFFISVVIGITVLFAFPEISNKGDGNYIKNLATIEIIKNNIGVAVKLIMGGMTLGLLTVIKLFLNGFISGIMIGIHTQNYAISIILIKTVIHGFFELTGIVICGAIGLKPLLLCIRGIKGYNINFKAQIKDSIVLLVFSIIFIVIGGLIEGILLPMI